MQSDASLIIAAGSLGLGMLGFAINQWRVSTKSAAMLAAQHESLRQLVEAMSESVKEMKAHLYSKGETIDANKQAIALLIAAQTRCTNDVASAHRQLESLSGKHHDLEKFIYTHVAEGQQR